tara:strand:+ start:1097 stop:1549 length:453 start_codon:yes stop_codon:yes gene_type:complete
MKKEWKHPFWENYQKDRITAKLIINHSDGKTSSSTATVSKYTRDGNLTEDYELIIAQNGIEKIDRNTKEREDRHRQRHEAEKRQQSESDQARKLEYLFNAKLEVFEIDAIKNSTNRKLKSKIRKSKNIYEMQAFLGLLVQEEYNNEIATK